MESILFRRVSTRDFSERPIGNEKIEYLLRAAMAAPSACNQQPWEFYVVRDRNTLIQMAHCSPFAKCLKKAPLSVVTCQLSSGIRVPECALMDVSTATENLLLAAVEMGLGAVWQAVYPYERRVDKLRALLEIPENLVPIAMVAVGYPKESQIQQDRFCADKIHWIEGTH